MCWCPGGVSSRLALLFLLGCFPQFSVAQTLPPPRLPSAFDADPRRSTMLWAPHLEWRVKNASCEGDRWDIAAAATFVHESSGEKHTTGMFYDGEDTWAFRFTGTRTGQWNFRTSSSDPDLDGRHGTVVVEPNPDGKVKGFLSHQDNKYAVQRGSSDDLEGYLFNVYMGRVNFDANLDAFGTDLERVAVTTRDYLDEARENGCEIIFVHVNNNWLKFGEHRHDRHESVHPDPTTFRVLETIIITAHQAGGRVHVWMWGDEQRRWTPLGLPGGANGEVDRRLQRYIAARLGPLPGWTMGYGFDLHEWTNEEQVNAWAQHLQEHLGWRHLLSARAFRLRGPHAIQSYENVGREVPLTSTAHGPRDCAEIVEHLDAIPGAPGLYEERHTYRRPGFNLDMDGTRRLLWWQAMAGGMGGFIGFYPADSGAFGGHPYRRPEQLRTHYTFWHTHRRFLLHMQRDSELSGSGAWVLRGSDNAHYVVYQEQTDAIEIDLSGMKGPQPAVAVDVTQAYQETDLGVLDPGRHRLKLPHTSDWAIAAGAFERQTDDDHP